MPERRFLRKFRNGLRLGLDRLYRTRHPGGFGRFALRGLSPLLAGLNPNDRWSLPIYAAAWSRAAELPPAGPAVPAKRILLFSAYNGQISADLAMATLLAWRGHRVTIGYLPKLRSPVKDPLRDHPSAAAYVAGALAPVERASGGRIRCVDLSVGVNPLLPPPDPEFVRSQAKADVVMRLLRETIDENDRDVRIALDYYLEVGRAGQQAACQHLDRCRGDYDICLVPNGTTFEGAQMVRAAKLSGLPVTTYEKFAFRNVRVMNHGDDFRAFLDLDLAWNNRDRLKLAQEPFYSRAVARARSLLDERRRSTTSSWAWSLQQAPDQTTAEALADIGLQPGEPFALVCTNVPYDAGYDKLTRFFPSMHEWLVQTVRTLLERTDLRVVVRAHPGEAAHYGGKERSEINLERAGLLGHQRLLVITGEQKTNTYGLMESCRFGAVFSSTTGLEMAMLGKAVAIGADVYYRARGFTSDAESGSEYADLLVELARSAPALSEAQRADAALFHFILHFVMQWPFPYDKPSAIAAWPPDRLLRDPAMARYISTLDALVLSDAEWAEAAPSFLSATGANHVSRALDGGR